METSLLFFNVLVLGDMRLKPDVCFRFFSFFFFVLFTSQNQKFYLRYFLMVVSVQDLELLMYIYEEIFHLHTCFTNMVCVYSNCVIHSKYVSFILFVYGDAKYIQILWRVLNILMLHIIIYIY